MKKSNYWKSEHGHLYGVMLAFIALCFLGCKDNSEKEGDLPFSPDIPIVISDFTPKEGGLGSRLVLYGDNFGNDISKVKVTIGGQDAKVIGVKNESLYCIVPAKAYTGDIEVCILGVDGEEIANGKAEKTFAYQKKLRVTTFLGKHYENANDVVKKEGPFNDCGALMRIFWLTFDPQNHNHLYYAGDTESCRLIDFEKEYVSYFSTGLDRVDALSWTMNGDMVISHNHASDTKIGNYLSTRSSNFTQKENLNVARGVNGAAIHPVNGELYYTRYRAGDIRRYDFETKKDELAFNYPYTAVAVYLVIHPTGNYAYLIGYEKNYIMRSDYDWDKKTFTTPYLVCGLAGTAGYADGVGSSARLNGPVQGTFAKNPEYAGQADEYDFYFCDKNNHAVRKLTPLGRVSTFAGRGNNGDKGYSDGDLRTEARFNSPEGIIYDEERQCFFVGDSGNYLLRKIANEE